MRNLARAIAILILGAVSCLADQQYAVTGMVLKVDQAHKTFTASCQDIPGYMSAMTMPFDVRQTAELNGIQPGMSVSFTLVVGKESAYAEHIQIYHYQSAEQDPLTARRLKLLRQITHPSTAAKPLTTGQAVPNFSLTDQAHRTVSLAQFKGKLVAINFIYTSCALPTYCFRISNNFGMLQRRFKDRLGRDLVLLTVTFDPQRDQPETLARYAKTWKADPDTWHFLTGNVPDVQRVTNLFGVDFFPDEGLMNHSLHTAIIDRQGKLAVNIEGNQFTGSQLGDLVQTMLEEPQKKQLATNIPLKHSFLSFCRDGIQVPLGALLSK
jgi:protein SCO1